MKKYQLIEELTKMLKETEYKMSVSKSKSDYVFHCNKQKYFYNCLKNIDNPLSK